MMLHLPADHTAATVRHALIEAFEQVPAGLRRTLTWEQARVLRAAWQASLW
jgi:hypothetical protein